MPCIEYRAYKTCKVVDGRMERIRGVRFLGVPLFDHTSIRFVPLRNIWRKRFSPNKAARRHLERVKHGCLHKGCKWLLHQVCNHVLEITVALAGIAKARARFPAHVKRLIGCPPVWEAGRVAQDMA